MSLPIAVVLAMPRPYLWHIFQFSLLAEQFIIRKRRMGGAYRYFRKFNFELGEVEMGDDRFDEACQQILLDESILRLGASEKCHTASTARRLMPYLTAKTRLQQPAASADHSEHGHGFMVTRRLPPRIRVTPSTRRCRGRCY